MVTTKKEMLAIASAAYPDLNFMDGADTGTKGSTNWIWSPHQKVDGVNVYKHEEDPEHLYTAGALTPITALFEEHGWEPARRPNGCQFFPIVVTSLE